MTSSSNEETNTQTHACSYISLSSFLLTEDDFDDQLCGVRVSECVLPSVPCPLRASAVVSFLAEREHGGAAVTVLPGNLALLAGGMDPFLDSLDRRLPLLSFFS